MHESREFLLVGFATFLLLGKKQANFKDYAIIRVII